MKCPRCESRKLWIHVRFSGYVLCESGVGDDVEVQQSASMNSDWDEESPCRCHACHWTGAVAEVKENERDPAGGGVGVRNRQAVTSLAEVKRRLKSQPCPVVWSDCIHYLLARLQKAEEQAKRSESAPKKPGPDCDDTAIM